MATRGLEYETVAGLDWIGGDVAQIRETPGLKIPHMGWNTLQVRRDHPLLAGIATATAACTPISSIPSTLSRQPGRRRRDRRLRRTVTAMVGRENVVGTQFHPEKEPETRPRADPPIS